MGKIIRDRYGHAKRVASEIAEERQINVYIAKANNKDHYKLEFMNETTKNYTIIEEVKPQKRHP